MVDESPTDEVGLVYRWMHRLCHDDREAAEGRTAEVVRRFRQDAGPSWILARGPLLRLQYLTVLVVLDRGSPAARSALPPTSD